MNWISLVSFFLALVRHKGFSVSGWKSPEFPTAFRDFFTTSPAECYGRRVGKIFIASMLLLAFSFNSHSQTKKESLNYEIVVLGMKIGTMKAQKVNASDSLLYQVDSQVKFWFFGTVELQFKTRTHYLNGKLVKARSDSKTNRGNFSSRVDWKGTYYAVDAASYEYENKKPLKGPLGWSSTRIFFHEPADGDVFLSEVYGVTGPIRKVGPGSYEITVNGNTNRYYYSGGKLEKIVVENAIKNYQVRLVN
jgi:hypothetical protein